MRRLALLLTLCLVACAPSFEPAEGRATFTAEDGILFFSSDTSIAYGTATVRGDVTSAYRTGVTSNGFTILDLPEGDWGTRKQVGKYVGQIEGSATIVLVGGSEGLEADLE